MRSWCMSAICVCHWSLATQADHPQFLKSLTIWVRQMALPKPARASCGHSTMYGACRANRRNARRYGAPAHLSHGADEGALWGNRRMRHIITAAELEGARATTNTISKQTFFQTLCRLTKPTININLRVCLTSLITAAGNRPLSAGIIRQDLLREAVISATADDWPCSGSETQKWNNKRRKRKSIENVFFIAEQLNVN